MYLVIDVHYFNDDYAVASGILFVDWGSSDFVKKVSIKVEDIKPYEPGSFYERELPCILSLLNEISPKPDLVIIDGYVTLGAEGRKGLGAHLYHALGEEIPIIGVAKNSFAGTPDDKKIYRGESEKPLYVTSIGIDQNEAKRLIQSMQGDFRIPTLLKMVDSECRSGIT